MAYLGKTPSQAVRSRYFYTATGGETSLSGADNNGDTLIFADGNYVDVYLNGVLLVAGTDYNVNTTNTIAGLVALTASDIVEIVVYDTFSVFGGTFQGALTADSINADIFGSHQFTARNVQGSTILKGTPVYIAGHSGNDPEIAIADADVAAKMPAFGIAATDIANNTKGNVVVFGNYIGIDTSAFAVGDELYVSNTGTLTTTRPSGSADKVQKIAKVIRSQSQNGQIFVMGAGRSNDTPNAITTNSINLSSSTTVSSVLDEDAMTSNSATALATQQSIKAYVDNQIGSNNELSEILTNGNTTGGNNIAFGDNDKAIFGAGSDLQIYHDGSNSWINEVGTGQLILAGEDVRITTPNAGEFMATFGVNGAATLYYDNAAKIATTATGVDVTGTVTADSVGVGAAPNATFGSLLYTQGTPAANKPIVSAYSQGNSNNAGFALFNDSGNRGIWTTGSTMRFTRTYEGNSTADVTIDASGNLLVGGTSQSGAANRAAIFSANKFGLSVIDTTSFATNVGGALNLGGNYRTAGDAQAFCRVEALKENATDGNFAYGMAFSTTPNGGTFTEAMRIDSSGNVGIGGSPTENFEVFGAATNGTAKIGQLMFKNSSGNYAAGTDGVHIFPFSDGNTYINNFDGGFVFRTNASVEKMRILSSGGITFNGDTAAANALDDYEEGTWSPVIGDIGGNNATMLTSSGKYVKVGNLVTANFICQTSSLGSMTGAYVFVKGLPFNHTGSNAGTGMVNRYAHVNTSNSGMNLELGGGIGSWAWITYIPGTSAVADGYLPVSYLNSNFFIQGTLVYTIG